MAIFENIRTMVGNEKSMTKEERKEYNKAYRESHREYYKAYRESNKESRKEYSKAYYQSHKKNIKEYNKAYLKAYNKNDVNSSGKPKHSIRNKSYKYLTNHGTKITGYEIHHCFTYDEPYKFIYCSRETHLLIHAYLRQNNIDADSEHYEQIKHLLDDTVILYGIKDEVSSQPSE